jgi:hypothetical protein
MGWLFGNPDKVAALRDAQDALDANTDTEETDEYLELNSAVIEAAADVPWWRR